MAVRWGEVSRLLSQKNISLSGYSTIVFPIWQSFSHIKKGEKKFNLLISIDRLQKVIKVSSMYVLGLILLVSAEHKIIKALIN